MTVIMTCDHHEPGGHIEQSRSRRVIVDQLRAATALGDVALQLGPTRLTIDPELGPVVTLTLDQLHKVWEAVTTWRLIAPRPGRDLEYGDGDPTIRVPPDEAAQRRDGDLDLPPPGTPGVTLPREVNPPSVTPLAAAEGLSQLLPGAGGTTPEE